MSVVALLSVAPSTDESMAADVANAVDALEEHDVHYETTAMGTIIEANSVGDLLAAVGDAHNAVDADRVSTLLKIDDKRTTEQSAAEKVAAVEEELGRPPQAMD